MAQTIPQLKLPLWTAMFKEGIGLQNIYKYLRYYRWYISRFKWEVGDRDYSETIERILFFGGKILFINDSVMNELVCLNVDSYSEDYNGMPVKVNATGENNYSVKGVEVNQKYGGVICWADSTTIAPVIYIMGIVDKIANLESIIDTQNDMMRKPYAIVGTGEDLDNSMNNFFNSKSNCIVMKRKVGKDLLNDLGVEVLNFQLGNSYKALELWEARDKEENLIKDYFGYPSNNGDKRERQITSEVGVNTSIAETMLKDALHEREEAVKKIKTYLGIDIKLTCLIEQEKEKEVEDNGDRKERI